MQERPLEGKLAIVTGGSRGIGAAVARELAAKGASLLLGYTSDASTGPAEQLQKELSEHHKVQCELAQADLGQPKQAAKSIVEAAKQHFGSSGKLVIDILVNNAGIGGNFVLGDVPEDAFTRQYNVNVLAPLMLAQECLEFLPTDRSGRIINMSSVSSSLGFVGQTIYGGTKAALEAMTRTWSRELAERATVNAVNPGPVEGDMYYAAGEDFWRQMESWHMNTPLAGVRDGVDDPKLVEFSKKHQGGRRPGYGAEVAKIVAMLATPDSAWCTGSVVCANGGLRFSG